MHLRSTERAVSLLDVPQAALCAQGRTRYSNMRPNLTLHDQGNIAVGHAEHFSKILFRILAGHIARVIRLAGIEAPDFLDFSFSQFRAEVGSAFAPSVAPRTTFFSTVSKILRLGAQEKMAWSDTSGVVAVMAHLLSALFVLSPNIPRTQWAEMQLPRKSVGLDSLSGFYAGVKGTVATISGASPIPAASCLFNFRPETLLVSFAHGEGEL